MSLGARVQVAIQLELFRHGSLRKYAVNFGGHDEIVLMQSLDLLGLQRDRGIAPPKLIFG